jgi:hypothetical protein
MAAFSTRMSSLYASSKGITTSITTTTATSTSTSSQKVTRAFSKVTGTNAIQKKTTTTTKKSHRFHHYPSTQSQSCLSQSYVNGQVRAHSTAAAAVAAEVETEDGSGSGSSSGSGSWDHNHHHYDKHCKTCTCDKEKQRSIGQSRQELPEHSDSDSDSDLNDTIPVPVPPCGIPSIYYQNNQNNQVTVTQTSTSANELQEEQEEEPQQSEPQQQQQQQQEEDADDGLLPPPLPEPAYSVRRRLLSDCPALTALDSPRGHVLLVQALQRGTAASYIPLTQHFTNQSEPAFCGVTTLLTVLNALAVDPGTRWRGGWRYFGDEDVLLSRCCLSAASIRRVGISMPEFAQLAACQGLRVTMKHPVPVVVAADADADAIADADTDADADDTTKTTRTAVTGGLVGEKMATVDDFRRDIRSVLVEDSISDTDMNMDMNMNTDDDDDTDESDQNDTKEVKGILVVSFARYALGQTGDGHFSPVAAYHEATDQCLVLDVARFKYQPYWVSVSDLFASTLPVDSVTEQPRGWYLLQPPVHSASYKGMHIATEERRPAKLVPTVEEGERCPVHEVKVKFCPVRRQDDE